MVLKETYEGVLALHIIGTILTNVRLRVPILYGCNQKHNNNFADIFNDVMAKISADRRRTKPA